MKTERELFQAWYEDAYHEISQMLPSGQYASLRQQHSWEAWQACANREGYKLVPVEPSKYMLNSGYRVRHDKIIDLGNVYKAMIGAVNE